MVTSPSKNDCIARKKFKHAEGEIFSSRGKNESGVRGDFCALAALFG